MSHLLRYLRFAIPHLVHGALIMAVLSIHVISPSVTCLDHLDAEMAASHHHIGDLAGIAHHPPAPPPKLAKVDGVQLPACALQAPDGQQPLLLAVNEPFVEPDVVLAGAVGAGCLLVCPPDAPPSAYMAAVAAPPPRTA